MKQRKRHRLLRVLSFALLIVSCGVGLVVTYVGSLWMVINCPGYDDEGTIAAPESPRYALICTDDGARDGMWLLLPFLILSAGAVTVWVQRRNFVVLLAFCAAMVVLPGVTAAVTTGVVRGDCTAEQWSEFGAAGCERNLEVRTE